MHQCYHFIDCAKEMIISKCFFIFDHDNRFSFCFEKNGVTKLVFTAQKLDNIF